MIASASAQTYIDIAIEMHPPHCSNMLTITEFIENTEYCIDKLCIDKFWASLHDNQLIYVDDEIIRWMGFDAAQAWRRKNNFIELLKNNNIRYIEYTNDDYSKFISSIDNKTIYPPAPVGKGTGTLKHIFLSADSLKLAMMTIGKGKGKHIKEHYIALEKLFFIYFKYQCEFKKISMEIELLRLKIASINKIRQRECLLIDTSPHIECVYFIRADAAVKIGRTDNIRRRIIELQIGSSIKLIIERTILTDIGPCLESKLHGIYSSKHIHGEWYNLTQEEVMSARAE